MIFNSGVKVLSIPVENMEKIIVAADNFRLDFDDAYQYVAAESHGLTIVSFDADFNRTERGCKAPTEILGN
jgi:predicted nucleic acid-binding protein